MSLLTALQDLSAARPEVEERLQRADELARGLVASAAPLSFVVAYSPEELDAIYRLRYQVVTESGWARPEDFPDDRERDEYDDLAIHIGAWDGATLAAASRIVLPSRGLPLPTERAFEVTIKPRGKVADTGRQIVSRRYGSMQHQVFAALLAKTWLEMHTRGYVWAAGDCTTGVARLCRLLGFEFEQIGPARRFWGEDRFPIVIDVISSVPTLIKRWSRLAGRGL